MPLVLEIQYVGIFHSLKIVNDFLVRFIKKYVGKGTDALRHKMANLKWAEMVRVWILLTELALVLAITIR